MNTFIKLRILELRLDAATAAAKAREFLPGIFPYEAVPIEAVNEACFVIREKRDAN